MSVWQQALQPAQQQAQTVLNTAGDLSVPVGPTPVDESAASACCGPFSCCASLTWRELASLLNNPTSNALAGHQHSLHHEPAWLPPPR